jgi:hypothetical protein
MKSVSVCPLPGAPRPAGSGSGDALLRERSNGQGPSAGAEGAIDGAVGRAVGRLLARQEADGRFAFCLEANVLTDACVLIALRLGCDDGAVPLVAATSAPAHPDRLARGLIARIRARQRGDDGAWTRFPYGQLGDQSSTVECYVALQLWGVGPDDPARARAREFIVGRGGRGPLPAWAGSSDGRSVDARSSCWSGKSPTAPWAATSCPRSSWSSPTAPWGIRRAIRGLSTAGGASVGWPGPGTAWSMCNPAARRCGTRRCRSRRWRSAVWRPMRRRCGRPRDICWPGRPPPWAMGGAGLAPPWGAGGPRTSTGTIRTWTTPLPSCGLAGGWRTTMAGGAAR